MSEADSQDDQRLRLYATAVRPCSYLDGRDAVSAFVDPAAPLTPDLYEYLAGYGFRRSGDNLYVPSCPSCTACVPVRIAVNAFRPSRSQRRVARRNRDLTVRVLPAHYREEHYSLYTRYLQYRHPDGGMTDSTPVDYLEFLTGRWSETFFIEFRQDDDLLAVAVTDRLGDSLSAVYTFFEPHRERRSLGTFAILEQIYLARELGQRWLYLGYWIEACSKMTYKQRFRPLQMYLRGRWMTLQADQAVDELLGTV